MKIPQNLMGFLFLVLSMFLNIAIANEVNLSKDNEGQRQLVVASSNNFPPINLLNDSGELTGFAKDLMAAVAKSSDVEVRHIHSSVWTEVLKWLEEGKADLIHDTGFTPERESYLDFTVPIIEMPESIFVREKQFNIKNFAALKGKKVACVNQHITHIYLQRFKDFDCYLVNTPAEGLIALINGNAEAFIYPEQIILYLAQQLGLDHKVKIVGEPVRVLSWSMTVKKGNTELLVQLNRGIKAVKASGEYQRIYNKWFGKRLFSGYTQKEVYTITTVAVVLAILVVITIGLMIYSRSMRKANRALSESETKYRTLADKLPESIFLKDTNSVYIFCNQQFAESLGIKPTEIAGKTDFDFFPDSASGYREGDRKVLESGETIEFIENYEEEGRIKYINTIKTPVYNDEGKLTGVLGIFWDITEQRNLQDKLSATVTEYNAITATVPDVMYKLDREGRLTWWNSTLEKVTGLKPEQLQNLYGPRLIAEQDQDRVTHAIQQAFEHGYAEVEARLQTVNGEPPYYFNGARILDDNGKLLGLAGSGRDMSKQKEAEEQQEMLQQQLHQAQKMESIGQLTGGIAHDFNNMLTSILGYGALSLNGLEQDFDKDKLQTYLSEIIRSGERARDLVAQMLTFSRVHKGEERPVEIGDFIDQLISMLRPMIPTTIELKTIVDSHLPIVSIDPVMIQQVLINLCINARDAMEGQGTITVSTTRSQIQRQICDSCHSEFSGDYIQLTVTDTGQGIEPQDISRIFEPFMTTKEVGKGTGMGLAMVHGTTHEHLGHIGVTSQPGNTSITIYLPASNVVSHKPDKEESQDKTTLHYDSGKHHILVVDDEVSLVQLQKEMLSMHGYQVTAHHNALEALQAFVNNPDHYDLLITDQTMPDMSGGELAKKMLTIRPELPIVLCTGYSDQINEESAKQIGIQVFLKKPVNSQTLIKMVQQILIDEDVNQLSNS